MGYLVQGPWLYVAVVLIIMAGLAYVIVKPRKKKVQKVDSKKKEDVSTEEVVETKTEEVEQKEKKKKLKKLKPEITRVYEKKKLQSKETYKEEEKQDPIEEEFLKKMQFVKTSKNVSRLKPYTPEEEQIQESFEEMSFAEEDCPICEEKHKSSYFDRSRRLSNMIKDGTFDDLFCSHISEKYMNMDDISRHIRNCDEIEQRLFERTAKTLANSEAKVNIDENGKVGKLEDKDAMRAWLEERRRQELAKFVTGNNEEFVVATDYNYDDIVQDEFDLSARTVLVVDSILNRKGKKTTNN